MLDAEFNYFKAHQEALVEKYLNQFVVIRGVEVVGAYPTLEDAFEVSARNYPLGTFLIQECLPGRECYTTIVGSAIF